MDNNAHVQLCGLPSFKFELDCNEDMGKIWNRIFNKHKWLLWFGHLRV